MLVCPLCKGELAVQWADGSEAALDCGACSLSFPIEDGIPVMLVEEANPLVA
ncbi:MAG: Trm112 family protein [bacterium]|nr:Trm112 family protein [bacterium]